MADNSQDGAGALPAGSQSQNQSSQSRKRRGPYRLKNGAEMKVVDVAPNARGELMVKMTWDVILRGVKNKTVMMKYSDLSQGKSKDTVLYALGCAVFLEDVDNQNSAFPKFIEDEIDKAEDARKMYLDDEEDGGVFANKPMKEFKEVTVEKIKDKMYLIAGEKEVFILNDGTSYSRKMSSAEIEELGIHIMWTSKAPPIVFESNDVEAVKALVDIIGTFNELQVEEFYGFPLAAMVAHFRAFLYEHLLEEQVQFYTSVTVSGEQHGTGKSLMFSIYQCILYGKMIPAEKHISESKLSQKLACHGDVPKVPVFVNEWDGKTDLFNNAVKGVWEGSSWSVSKSEGYVPKTVLLANANSTPEDIRMDAGVKSKVQFIYTGDIKLKSDRKLEITRGLVAKSKETHPLLPSVLGLALKTLFPRITDYHRLKYQDELEDDEDERGAQALKDYDALFHELQENYPEGPDKSLPPFFLGEPNHSVLTHFNTNLEQEEDNPETAKSQAARKFVKELVRTKKLGEALTKRSYREVEGYKVQGRAVPMSVQREMFKATESLSTTEGGKRIRLRFLPMNLLDIEDQNIIDEFLTSFTHVFKFGMDLHSSNVSQMRNNFAQMIVDSSRAYDRLNPLVERETDEREPSDGEGSISSTPELDVEKDLKCGTQGCPSKDTVWKSSTRLEEHRKTKVHQKAARGNSKAPRFKK